MSLINISLETVDEITLHRLADVENYSEYHAAGIVRDLLKGVQYLHNEDIIHANIKVRELFTFVFIIIYNLLNYLAKYLVCLRVEARLKFVCALVVAKEDRAIFLDSD